MKKTKLAFTKLTIRPLTVADAENAQGGLPQSNYTCTCPQKTGASCLQGCSGSCSSCYECSVTDYQC